MQAKFEKYPGDVVVQGKVEGWNGRWCFQSKASSGTGRERDTYNDSISLDNLG